MEKRDTGRGKGIIINGGMNGGLYYFYLLAEHEH